MSLQDLLDDGTSVSARTLQVCYNEPTQGTPLTENVFIDPRDTWCIGDGQGGDVLFVTAAAVEALQRRLTKEAAWTDGAIASLNATRHDYLLEHRVLVEELQRLATDVSLPALAAEIQLALDTSLELSEAAAHDAGAVANEADQDAVFCKVCYKQEGDEDLIRYLRSVGVNTTNELSIRLLLVRMRGSLTSLLIERERLTTVLTGLEGPGADLIGAMLAAADLAGTKLVDVIQGLQKNVDQDKRDGITDIVTKKLPKRYETLVNTLEGNSNRLKEWWDKLAEHEESEARAFGLQQEVRTYEQELSVKEATDAANKEAEREKHRRQEEKAAEAKAEADAKNAAQKAANDAIKDIDMDSLWDRLTTQEQMYIRKLEMQANKARDEVTTLQNQTYTAESEVESREKNKADLRKYIASTEQDVHTCENELENAEETRNELEEEEVRSRDEFKKLKKRRAEMEDEWEAANMPVPSANNLTGMEDEILAAEMRNKELSEELGFFEARERLYEGRVEVARGAWNEKEEATMSPTILKAPRTAPAPRQPKPTPSDVDLMGYRQRIRHPKYQSMDRNSKLYYDDRCVDKRLLLMQEEGAEVEARLREARQQEVVHHMPSGKDGSKVPLNFRRPEDLKTRLVTARRDTAHVASTIEDRAMLRADLRGELRFLGSELASHAIKGAQIYSDARQHFSASLVGLEKQTVESACPEREALLSALARHQSCTIEMEEAWSVAERACERAESKVELLREQQSCNQHETSMIHAIQQLYKRAAETVVEGEGRDENPSHVCCKRFCKDMEAATPTFDAVRAVCAGLWPRVLRLAEDLDCEKQIRSSLDVLYKEKDRNRRLLTAELTAPPEARRALARVRAALKAGAPVQDAMRADDHLHAQAIAKSTEGQQEQELAQAESAEAVSFTVFPTTSYVSFNTHRVKS
eukprot:TRINITY_DN26488_c0_g1_i1.p1 TRINITY_DN26488_c0_g1~~TRINITY_DN26488_c0_g1_i1.p1  ORF type:complete len:926 (+),score=204.73 TRINITY_DN26488_c0_g1_i1:147-2924(+)